MVHPRQHTDNGEQRERDPSQGHNGRRDAGLAEHGVCKAGAVPVARPHRGADEPQDPQDPAPELLVWPVLMTPGVVPDGAQGAHRDEQEHAIDESE